jgi:hypothetical protein
LQGSISLSDYLGVETSFNLDKESHTMALIFREMIIILALPSREILIKWQVVLIFSALFILFYFDLINFYIGSPDESV